MAANWFNIKRKKSFIEIMLIHNPPYFFNIYLLQKKRPGLTAIVASIFSLFRPILVRT